MHLCYDASGRISNARKESDAIMDMYFWYHDFVFNQETKMNWKIYKLLNKKRVVNITKRLK